MGAIPAAIGAGASLFGALNSAHNQKRSLNMQQQLAQQQQGMFHQAMPYYAPLLNFYAQQAGLNLPGMGGGQGVPGSPTGNPGARSAGFGTRGMGGGMATTTMGMPTANTAANPGVGSLSQPATGPNNGALGIYGSNPADVYRFQKAEEDIGGSLNRLNNQAAFRMNQSGVGGSTAAAAMNQNTQNAFNQLANYRRQLATNAGQEQERRMGLLGGALSPGFGGGQQASNTFGQQGQLYGQQAMNAGNQLGGALNAYMGYEALKNYGYNNPYMMGGMGGVTAPMGYGGSYYNPMYANPFSSPYQDVSAGMGMSNPYANPPMF